MAISYVGGNVGSASGSTTADITVALNSGLTGGSASSVSEGDLVIVTVSLAHSDDAPTANLVSSGYTALTQLDSDDTRDTALRVHYKFMGATPDTSVVIARSGNIENSIAWAVQVFAGVDSTTPMDVTPTTATGIDSGFADPPAITPVTAGAWIVICAGNNISGADNFTWSGDFVDSLVAHASDTQDASVGAAYYTGWTSGSYNPAASTTNGNLTSASWCAYTLALRPAGTGVTASASITLGAMTLASGSAAAIAGAAAITLGAATLSADGDVAIVGAATITLGAMTLLGDFTITTPGEMSASITLGDLALASAVSVRVVGDSGITLGAATLAATFEVGFPERLAAADITLGAATLSATLEVLVAASASITLGELTLLASSEEITGDGRMGLEAFVSDYDGDLGDKVHNFLLANTTGTAATWTTPDLWLKFFTELGYLSGTVNDRMREFLIDYTAAVDTGQTINDLWALIELPYTPAP